MAKQAQHMRMLAPEDIARGDYVTVTHHVHEFFPFWQVEPWQYRQGESPRTQRVTFMADNAGRSLKVTAVCLPFVLVKTPEGGHETLDVRRQRLARLSPAFGKRAFKAGRSDRASSSVMI